MSLVLIFLVAPIVAGAITGAVLARRNERGHASRALAGGPSGAPSDFSTIRSDFRAWVASLTKQSR